ncbi:unnamed protein product [Prunus brigantina]
MGLLIHGLFTELPVMDSWVFCIFLALRHRRVLLCCWLGVFLLILCTGFCF